MKGKRKSTVKQCKPIVQKCKDCGAPYISAEKHAPHCPANPEAQARGLQELCELCGARYYHLEGHECPGKPDENIRSRCCDAPTVRQGIAIAPQFNEPPEGRWCTQCQMPCLTLKLEGPNVVIPRRHQSAPKEHWADREVRLAAQEIVEGKAPADVPSSEFFQYGETQTVAHHPRVIEAMKKLETEMDEVRTTQELIEKTAMYHEMNERASQRNQWDGQGRWIGRENEEMRQGELLTPQAFMARLEKVIGPGRVELNTFAVLKRVAILVPDPDYKETRVPSKTDMQVELLHQMEILVDKNIDMKKQLKAIDATLAAQKVIENAPVENLRGKKQVATLQYPLGTEWMIMKFDDYGVPVCAKYLGWRTALLSLISLSIITEKEAHKAFPVTSGPAAEWYKEQLQMLRNRGVIAS